jgi:nucleoside-diphosphate-sugar epimerase
MTILEFAHTVLDVVESDAEIAFVEPQDVRTKDDPKVRCPDISRAQTELDWEPTVPVEAGLKKTADYFHRKLGIG